METRLSSNIFGLGSKVTCHDSKINGSKLPTNLQVLRCMMYHIEEGLHENRTKWESSKLVLSQVKLFYEKANIPMISERKACEKIIKLLDDNAKLRAIPLNRRSAPNTVAKIKEMEDKLALTFPLWPVNVEKQIKNKDDLSFLKSMQSDRLATFGSYDKSLGEKVKRRQQRLQLQEIRREAANREISSNVIFNDNDSPNPTDDDSDDQSETNGVKNDVERPSRSTRCHHRNKRTGTNLFIPYDIMKKPNLVSLATRLSMSPAQQAAYTKAIITELGGETSTISASYATTDRSRRQVAMEISTACKEQWCFPKYTTLHWDTKLATALSNKYKTEERLTIVVGNVQQQKILAVPAYPQGTDRKCGSIIADLIYEQLTSWQCTQTIVNMTFDTTSANTGHVTAACISVQKKLGRALLWSACRHHIGEIILSHVFDDLKIEASKSPDVTLFKRFRDNFDHLDHSELEPYNSKSVDVQVRSIVNSLRANAIQTAKCAIDSGKYRDRDDYMEFTKLCLIYLDFPNVTEAVKLNRPGALHKARWMAKLLYTMKMCLLEQQIQQLPTGTITSKQQTAKLRDFANFVTLIYSTWWITCDSAINAPWNDLKMLHSLIAYKTVHSIISESAISAFENHYWYLTEEMVPLALWSSKVPPQERKAIANAMLASKPNSTNAAFKLQCRYGMDFGKPKFPKHLTANTTLSDLVGVDSWFLFYLLELDSKFLLEDVSEWSNSASYTASLTKLQAINVVNDCAERGFKLSTDFIDSAKCEDHFQNVLQVVEQDRRKHGNLRK